MTAADSEARGCRMEPKEYLGKVKEMYSFLRSTYIDRDNFTAKVGNNVSEARSRACRGLEELLKELSYAVMLVELEEEEEK